MLPRITSQRGAREPGTQQKEILEPREGVRSAFQISERERIRPGPVSALRLHSSGREMDARVETSTDRGGQQQQ